MNEYSPKFPTSVSGKDWRRPLRHPEMEAIGRRAAWLYEHADLSNDERAMLLLGYRELRAGDEIVAQVVKRYRIIVSTAAEAALGTGTDLSKRLPYNPAICPDRVPRREVHYVPEIELNYLLTQVGGFANRFGTYISHLESRYGQPAQIIKPMVLEGMKRRGAAVDDDQPGDPF
jgi:hypothetical protein